VQFETLQLRERGGSSHVTLDQAARALQDAIAHDGLAAGAREVFEAVRARLPRVSAPENADLEKLMQRIQALRAKTVAQGCTEQEALAAAEKVAELLDRHGLSLNELEFKAQPCEGIGIQTSRKRAGPIDTCTTAISAFFDCRVWQETNASGQLRYVFFGLRGDVAASQYLYEMVERAFETETARCTGIWKASDAPRHIPSRPGWRGASEASCARSARPGRRRCAVRPGAIWCRRRPPSWMGRWRNWACN